MPDRIEHEQQPHFARAGDIVRRRGRVRSAGDHQDAHRHRRRPRDGGGRGPRRIRRQRRLRWSTSTCRWSGTRPAIRPSRWRRSMPPSWGGADFGSRGSRCSCDGIARGDVVRAKRVPRRRPASGSPKWCPTVTIGRPGSCRSTRARSTRLCQRFLALGCDAHATAVRDGRGRHSGVRSRPHPSCACWNRARRPALVFRPRRRAELTRRRPAAGSFHQAGCPYAAGVPTSATLLREQTPGRPEHD